MKNEFKVELKDWMKNTLSPYCLNSCKNSCCDCSKEGIIYINSGYENLFKTYKLNEKKVKFSNKILKKNKPHLYKDNSGYWYFTGGLCPNYDIKNKTCLIHNKHPMCALFPLEQIDKGYNLITSCELYKMGIEEEPLKSLFEIFKKHNLKLTIRNK